MLLEILKQENEQHNITHTDSSMTKSKIWETLVYSLKKLDQILNLMFAGVSVRKPEIPNTDSHLFLENIV
jgi:hypothetical protein